MTDRTYEMVMAGIAAFYEGGRTGELRAVAQIVEDVLDATLPLHRLYQEALVQIASFDDKVANDYLAETGYFSCFDEPGSVEIARKALSDSSKAP